MQTDDELLNSENVAAWECIQCGKPTAERVNRILSAILDDHLIMRLDGPAHHRILFLTVMRHSEERITAQPVWERAYGPFRDDGYAWQLAEKILQNIRRTHGISEPLSRGVN